METIRAERPDTAKNIAKRLGISVRTVQDMVALDRNEYLKRAADRRQKAFDMRSTGHTWQEIADAIGTTYAGARSLYYQQTKRLKAQQQTTRDPDTPDMFDE